MNHCIGETLKHESMNQWVKESVNQWSNEAMNQWSNKRGNRNKWGNSRKSELVNPWVMNQCITESVSHWANESGIKKAMNQWISWINEPGKQWFHQPKNRWTNDFMNQSPNQWTNEEVSPWINEWRNEWMDGGMNDWTDGKMTSELLPRATSSLTDFFVGHLSAISSLSNFLSGLPLLLWPFLLSCCFCNYIPLPAQCVLQAPAALVHSANMALCSKTTFRAAFTMRLATSSCNPAQQENDSITHAFLRPALLMRFLAAGLKTCRAGLVRFLWTTFPSRPPEYFSPLNLHTPFMSQWLDDGVDELWWCGWHGGVNANRDHRP